MAASSEGRRKEILSYLRGKSQPITAAELAARFDVSERTIYRDLDSLRESGVSVDARRSTGGGFHLSIPAPEIRPHVTPTPARRGRSIPRVPLVGRKAELEALVEIRERTASGTGSALVLSGEPGIGKSRLASEFSREAAASGDLVLTARCNESSGSPAYWPWIQLIENAARELPLTDLPLQSEQLDRLRQIAPSAVEPGSIDPERISWRPENPAEAEFLLNQAIAELFTELGRHRTLVLLIEDIHWADKQSLGALEALVDLVHEAPITILCTMRTVDANDDGAIARVRARILLAENCNEIQITGLSDEEVRELCAMSESTGISPDQAAEIFRQTEGNPFFAIEILLLLERQGDPETLASLKLPESVTAAISRRLDFVSDACRRMLTAGAVLGREFSFDEVHYMLGRISDEDLLNAVDEALEAGLIEEAPSSGERYQFNHAIIERVLYESLSPSRRARSHAQAASGLENLYGEEGADEIPTVLAHHLMSAGPSSDSERIVHYCRLAGDAALKSLAFEEALGYYEASIVNTNTGTPVDVLGDLYRGKGSAQYFLLITPDWLDSLKTALDNYERAENASKIVELTAIRWGTGFGRVPGLPDFHATGLEFVEPNSREYVMIRANYAHQLVLQRNDFETSIRIQEELLPLAERMGAHDASAFLCLDLALNYGCLMKFDKAEEHRESARQFIAKSGSPASTYDFHHVSIVANFSRGDLAQAESHIGAMEQMFDSGAIAGSRVRVNIIRFNASLALFRGKWDRLDSFEAEIRDNNPDRAHTDRLSAIVEALCGDPARAIERCIAAYETDYRGDPAGTTGFDHALCEIALISGDKRAAGLLDHAAENAIMRQKFPLAQVRATCFQGIAAVLRGDRETIARCYSEIAPSRADLQYNLGPGAPDRLLGVFATALGNFDDAEKQFEGARSLCESAGSQPWLALTLRDHASMYLRRDGRGDRGNALRLIREASDICGRYGMTPVASQLADLEIRASTGGRSSSRNPAGMTDREIEVLQFLATGVTNREIAAELVISENTVVRHVANIFAKIGVSNRTEAATYATREAAIKDQ